MRTAPRLLLVLLAAVLGLTAAPGLALGPDPAEGVDRAAAPVADVGRAVGDRSTTKAAGDPLLPEPARGVRALRQLGDDLSTAAARNDLRPARLRTLLRTDRTAWLDSTGALYYVEPAHGNHDLATDEPGGSGGSGGSGESGEPAPMAAIAPLAETFSLHSNPGADLTIYLDVDGSDVSGTQWNAETGLASGFHEGWDMSDDGPAFNDTERIALQTVWQMVAEDYAPFDVDVTTEDPGVDGLLRSSAADTVYGTRVLISESDNAFARICARNCGGVAYVGVFDFVGDNYQPAWVFPMGTGTVKNIAEAASHEAGHNLALNHDGTSSLGYYEGQGVWAPIMGVGYGRPLAQWSRGSYPGANNGEDDLAILGGYLGLRTDEAPGDVGAPAPLPTAPAIITSRDDVDAYLLGSCGPGSGVTVLPVEVAANLDVRAVVYDASGEQIAAAAPASGYGDGISASGLGATVTIPDGAGEGLVLTIDGVGEGAWNLNGYDDYASLGRYTVAAPGCDGSVLEGTPSEPTSVATGATGPDRLTLTWTEPTRPGDGPITGYQVSRSGSGAVTTLSASARSHEFTALAPDTSYTLTVRAVNATGAGPAVSVNATTDSPPRPDNDDALDAQVLEGASGSVSGDNALATGEAIDPPPPTTYTAGGYSVWYSWTPSADGPVVFHTSGGFPGRDTLLAAYTGEPGGLTQVAGNDDAADLHARIEFDAVAGTRYLLVVDGFPGYAPGTGPFDLSWSQQPVGPPAAPAGVSATPADGAAAVSWSAPDDNGSPITGYTVTLRSPGEPDRSEPTTGTEATVSGLVNGTTYAVTVTATNALGTSPASEPVEVTPEVPDTSAPEVLSIASTMRQVDSFFHSGATTIRVRLRDDRGITGTPEVTIGTWSTTWDNDLTAPLELVRGSRTDGIWTAFFVLPFDATSGPWNAWVSAADAWGNRIETNRWENTVFERVSNPGIHESAGTPTNVRVVPGDGQVRISWQPPAAGSTDYLVWVGETAESHHVTGTTELRIDGLPNGEDVSYSVIAANEVGESAPTEPTSPVSPAAVPPAPRDVTAAAGIASATVSWELDYLDEDVDQFRIVSVVGPDVEATVSGEQRQVVLDGLTPGAAYRFAVTAENAAGNSIASTPSDEIVPDVEPEPEPAPDPPSAVVARAKVNAATVSWTHEFGPFSPTTGRGYTVTAAPGGATCDTDGERTCRVSGLSNGRAYTFTVVARDASGASEPSAPSEPVTPRTDTAAPVIESMTVEPGRVSSTGGEVGVEVVVTDDLSGLADGAFGLTVIFNQGPDGQSFGFGGLARVEGDELRAVFRGQVPVPAGTRPGQYRLTVYPISDEAGNGTCFCEGPALRVGNPAAPAQPTASAASGRGIEATWPEPADDGGNLITSYEMQTDLADELATVDAATSTVDGVVTGAIDASAARGDEPVRVRVRAVNAGGRSDWSAWSEPLTVPAVVPGVPSGVSAVAGDGSAVVSWVAPDSDGGSPVTGYRVVSSPGGVSVEVGAGVREVVVSGLVNGTGYSFSVVALNEVGASEASPASPGVIPFGRPGKPAKPRASAKGARVVVTWKAPDGNGRRVDRYTVILQKGKQRKVIQTPRRKVVVPRLTAGVWKVRVAAISEGGRSAWSTPAAVRVRRR